ncbi:POP1-domain-containing protein [Pluteus cervinus]|uniref:POP1-domain-containing protein n=1 Tax=Pluteus cervinus TaxID=181527 RepID=A0ACD3AX26_9AGAR|nr:POP1-domain-containing protein [Pluteus cervinus]
MAPKRKNDESNEPQSSRDKKKQKVVAARTIAVQKNAIPGPSTIPNSMKGLPGAIDVEKFAEARAFEIDAMQDAIKNASSAATHRAWQVLPRHLRRRAASHDVRRVPLRLREKARSEMDPVKKKALNRTLHKPGKGKKKTRTEDLLKRQRDKSWLETHLWHAKRMHMEEMWGYRLAVQPTEKSFRPSHRASTQGSIIHDASYFSFIELKGPGEILKKVLCLCSDPQGAGPGSPRYYNGDRALETHIYRPGGYPFGYVAPIMVIWKANPIVSQDTETQKKSKTSSNDKGKGKEKGTPSADLEKVVWIRIHPSVSGEIKTILQSTISAVLENHQKEGGVVVEIQMSELRDEVNVFEILGPKSNQVMRGALKPIPQDRREDFVKFWSGFAKLQTSGSLPRGVMIGFTVTDPRLSFPPSNAKMPTDENGELLPPPQITPSVDLAQCDIWDDRVRLSLSKPRYTKAELDERRSKNLVPGTPLQVERQDNRVPVLLIQSSLGSDNAPGEALHGWTMIVPAGWSMAFWSSLTFTGTRVGGQRERQTQAFEAGTAYFPRDFPLTPSYGEYVRKSELQESDAWYKKPPAKRVNYPTLKVRSPWRADWEVILGIEQVPTQSDDSYLPAQREEPAPPASESSIKPWLIRGPDLLKLLGTMSKYFNPAQNLLDQMTQLRVKCGHQPFHPKTNADDLLKTCLVRVRVKLCGRGCPQTMAMICRASDSEVKTWVRGIQNGETNYETTEESDNEGNEEAPKEDLDAQIIGYITTGQFSLSRGEGFAIGAIALDQFLKLKEQTAKLFPHNTAQQLPMVKVRNRNSNHFRAGKLQILAD